MSTPAARGARAARVAGRPPRQRRVVRRSGRPPADVVLARMRTTLAEVALHARRLDEGLAGPARGEAVPAPRAPVDAHPAPVDHGLLALVYEAALATTARAVQPSLLEFVR